MNAPRPAAALGIADLQGHWRRAWLAADGYEDHVTRVHWIQAGSHFADLRVPDDRPDLRGAEALSDLAQSTLARLMQAEGFAGTIAMENGVCTWTRRLNWHGTPAAIDAGTLAFDAEGQLIEDGVHATYRELWRREETSPFRAYAFRAEGSDVLLLCNEERFLLVVDRPGRAASGPVIDALARGTASKTAILAQFEAFYALGQWTGDDGIAYLATNPFCEQRRVLEADGPHRIWHAVDFDGRHRAIPLEPVPT